MKPNCFLVKTFLTIMIVISFIGCQDMQDVTVPLHLIGIWETSAPKFEDRYLEFTERLIIFGTGEDSLKLHRIWKIETTKSKGNRILYTFHYKDSEGEKWTLALTYNPDSGGTIQLQNRDEIWEKSDETLK